MDLRSIGKQCGSPCRRAEIRRSTNGVRRVERGRSGGEYLIQLRDDPLDLALRGSTFARHRPHAREDDGPWGRSNEERRDVLHMTHSVGWRARTRPYAARKACRSNLRRSEEVVRTGEPGSTYGDVSGRRPTCNPRPTRGGGDPRGWPRTSRPGNSRPRRGTPDMRLCPWAWQAGSRGSA